MEELLYGAAYDLRSFEKDRLEHDLMLMKRAGMNVIRFEQSAWSDIKPEDEESEFQRIDFALNASDAAGMKVIVGMGIRSHDAEQLLGRIVEFTGRYRCVIGYQLGFDLIPTGKEESATFEGADFGDMDEVLRMAEIINTCKRPEQFVTSPFCAEGFAYGGNDPEEAKGQQSSVSSRGTVSALTVPGCDIYYPAQDDLTGAEIAYREDFMRDLRQGSPDRSDADNFYVLGTQAQGSPLSTPYPGQLRLQAYSCLAGGADMVMYSRWHSVRSGADIYYKGVLSHDMEPNPVYGEVFRVGTEWKRIGGKLLHLRKDNKAALVVDGSSREAFDRLSPVPGFDYDDIVHWFYDSLYSLNIECDVTELDNLDTAAYRMILTPALYSATELQIFRLRKFVDNGGVLVSSFQSFFTDEQQRVYEDRQPHFMTDVFGMSYQQFTLPGKMTVGGQPVEGLAELVTAEDAETLVKYQHKYWDRYAAATGNRYGLGKAYYIACMMDGSVLGRILLEAAADAGIITEAMDFEWPVIVRSGIGREGSRIHYILHYSEEERDIVCPYEAVELLSGEMYHIGDVLHLEDWDVKILEERKSADDQVTFIQ